MAKRKKPAPKRKKSVAKKTAVRKKTVARVKRVKKAAPKRKAATRSIAKKKPAARTVITPRPVPIQRPAPTAAALSTPAPSAPAAAAGEERIGVVTHYYGHLSVAAVTLESGVLRVGDMVRILGHTSDFRQRVDSMQIEHQSVAEARAGEEIGLRVTGHAREHDLVYKVSS